VSLPGPDVGHPLHSVALKSTSSAASLPNIRGTSLGWPCARGPFRSCSS